MIDAFDAKLLNLLQGDARSTAEHLSQEVGLSPSAVQRRLAKLRETGVIRSEIAVVSPAAVGRSLTVIIEVIVERERPELLQRFKQSMKKTPEVMQCFYVTGDKDFIIIATMRDMVHYEQFINEFCVEHPNVRRFSTSVVVDPVKVGLAVPIEPNS